MARRKAIRADDLPEDLQTLIDESEQPDSVPSTPLEPSIPTKPPFREPTQSIFYTVKKMLGIDEAYLAFDLDILTNINSVFFTLYQLGVGPYPPFAIEGPDEVWTDFLPEDDQFFKAVRTYVYLKARLLFDPPTSGFLVENIKSQIEELEWRFTVNPTSLDDLNGSDDTSTSNGMVEMGPDEVRDIYNRQIDVASNGRVLIREETVENRSTKAYSRQQAKKRIVASNKSLKDIFR